MGVVLFAVRELYALFVQRTLDISSAKVKRLIIIDIEEFYGKN